MTTFPAGWHLLVEPVPLDGAEQMARDAGLRDLALVLGAPLVRLYAWAQPTVSFGAHEAALRRHPPERLAALGLAAVRRPTGGRAVLHRDDLTYAIALPPSTTTSNADALDGVHAVFARALAALGLAAQPAPRRRAPSPDGGGVCFDAALGGELLLDGAKVLGSAQHRSATGLLQHGSLLLADDQGRLRAGDAEDGKVTTVAAALGRAVSAAEAAALMAAAWVEATGPVQALAEADVASAAAPHRATFADAAWTWRR